MRREDEATGAPRWDEAGPEAKLRTRWGSVTFAPTVGAALSVLAASLAIVGQFLLTRTTQIQPLTATTTTAAFLFAFSFFFWLTDLPGGEAGLSLRRRILGPPWDEPGAGWRTFLGLRPWRGARPVARLCQTVARAPLRSAMVFVSLVMSGAVVTLLHVGLENRDAYWDVFVLWLLSVGLYVIALTQPQRFLSATRIRSEVVLHREALLDAALLCVAALALRVPGLGSLPGELGGDEGIVGNMAWEFGRGGGNIFGSAFGYGSLFYLLHSLPVVALDGGIAALRLPNAIGGSLAVPATYLAGRQLFGRRVGLIAGALLAASHMHVHLSRIALGHAIDALLAAAVLFTFMRGLDRRDGRWMALAGVGLGLSQYGYVAGRLLGLVFAAFVLVLAVYRPGYVYRGWRLFATALGSALLTAAPMIRWAFDEPGEYLARLNSRGFVQAGGLDWFVAATGRPAWQVMALQVRDAFLTVVKYRAALFYDAKIPMLSFFMAALFVVGFAYTLWRWHDRRFLVLSLSVIGALLLLTLGQDVEGAAYRIMGAMPAIMLLVAVTLWMLIEGAVRGLGVSRRVPLGLATGVVVFLSAYDLGYYFTVHMADCSYTDAKTVAASVASVHVGEQVAGTTVFALTVPHLTLDSYPSTQYLSQRQVVAFPVENPAAPRPDGPDSAKYIFAVAEGYGELAALVRRTEPAVVLAVPERADELDAIEDALPGGEWTSLDFCGDPVIEVYRTASDEG